MLSQNDQRRIKMKKLVVIVLVLSMLCPLLAVTTSAEQPSIGEKDWEALYNHYGLNVYIGKEIDTSPTLDGVISEGEYGYSRVTPLEELFGYETGEIQSDLEEFFAHDENYVYIGARFEQKEDNRAYWIQWHPRNTFDIYRDNYDPIRYYYNRIRYDIRYLSDGTTTHSGHTESSGPFFLIPIAGKEEYAEYRYAAAKVVDEAANVYTKTYEVRIAKAYIARLCECSVDEVRVIPYWTYFHASICHGAPNSEELAAAIHEVDPTTYVPLGDPPRTYWFLVLGDYEHEHNYMSAISVDDTTHEWVCLCGETMADEHNWDEGVVTTEPTHSEYGVKTFTCTDCGASRNENIERIPHAYGDWCRHDDDQHMRSCACGDVEYADHKWDEGTVLIEATPTGEGAVKYICDDCGENKTEVVEKLPAEPDGGCSAFLGGGMAVISVVATLGAAFVTRRKRK